MPQLSTGDNAPALILPAIDGSTFDMSNLKGKKVILTFFRFCLLYTSDAADDMHV